jgi:hypothetical protein
MGKHLRAGTQACWDFTPDDTDDKMYIQSNFGSITLEELLEKAKEKWPTLQLSDINISSEKIHTRAIYYDLHDASDWDDYIILELK